MLVDNDTGLPANLGEIMVSDSRIPMVTTNAWQATPAEAAAAKRVTSNGIYLTES